MTDNLVVLGEDWIEHFGVKGMKWGVRKQRDPAPITGPVKEPIVRKTANGDTLTLTPKPPDFIDKAMSKLSSSYREKSGNSSSLDIADKEGKKIGHATFWFKGKDDIYLNWIQIDKSARGNGYATEVLKAAAEHGKQTGRKRMVLEVPGNAPDARHIYAKMGFEDTGNRSGNKRDIWGGLTEMEYRFDKQRSG